MVLSSPQASAWGIAFTELLKYRHIFHTYWPHISPAAYTASVFIMFIHTLDLDCFTISCTTAARTADDAFAAATDVSAIFLLPEEIKNNFTIKY